MLKLFSLSLILPFFFSCSLVSFKPFTCDVSILPEADYFEGEAIEVIFSEPVEHDSIEKDIQLKKENSIVQTIIEWQEEKCTVRPEDGFVFGAEYTFTLSGQAKAFDGRAYPVDIKRAFVYGSEDAFFRLEKVLAPCDYDEKNFTKEKKKEALRTPLSFFFNKEMNIPTFEKNFTISPEMDFEKNYSANKKSVVLTPKKNWENGQKYFWSLGSVQSQDGYPLFSAQSGNFFPVNESVPPKLLFACPANVDEENPFGEVILEEESLESIFGCQGIAFAFDKEMDFDSVKKGVYMEPGISGFWRKKSEREFLFLPYENYRIGERYSIQVGREIKDIFSLPLENGMSISFTPSDKFIKVTSIFCNGTDLEKDKTGAIKLQNGFLCASITFSTDLTDGSLQRLSDYILLQPVFPEKAQSPRLERITVNSKNCVELRWSNLSSGSGPASPIYMLKICGGKNFFLNANGEYIKEDVCSYIKIIL